MAEKQYPLPRMGYMHSKSKHFYVCLAPKAVHPVTKEEIVILSSLDNGDVIWVTNAEFFELKDGVPRFQLLKATVEMVKA